jgi:hypothetical protein
MAIDFPNSPTTGDTHTVNGRTWTYDGTGWVVYGPSIDATVLRIDSGNNRVGINNSSPTVTLDVTGDTAISGNLAVGSIADVEADINNLESRPVETKTASYVLVASDVNKRIVMNNAGATTITVNDSVFAAGDTVWIHNIGAGTTTVTAGTATVNTAGSLDVGQWEGGSLYFTSASSAIFFRGGGAGVAVVSTEYLIQGGGGTAAFGTTWIGGGGGGDQLSNYGGDPLYLERGTSYTVTVGGGGSRSEFAGITAVPGGQAGRGAGGSIQGNGGAGANGGGGSANSLPAGIGIGKNGRNGGNGSSQSCGGGGGSGAVGSAASGTIGGAGGAGLVNSITGTAVGRGGGGGGGGTGGGGAAVHGGGAGTTSGGNSGTANTGGGGGGTGNATGSGAGGSGIVIIRFPTDEGSPTIGAGLTSSSATDGTDTVITFTAGTDTITWSA